jgi:hypothetical protein
MIYGESDYYKFTNTSSSSINAKITLSTTFGNADLYIYSTSYSLSGSSKNTGTTTDTVTVTLAAGASLYARVYGATSGITNYSIAKSW